MVVAGADDPTQYIKCFERLVDLTPSASYKSKKEAERSQELDSSQGLIKETKQSQKLKLSQESFQQSFESTSSQNNTEFSENPTKRDVTQDGNIFIENDDNLSQSSNQNENQKRKIKIREKYKVDEPLNQFHTLSVISCLFTQSIRVDLQFVRNPVQFVCVLCLTTHQNLMPSIDSSSQFCTRSFTMKYARPVITSHMSSVMS